jgi:hypothetical protein
MPASIIGALSSGSKILRRSDYSREIVGLETLTETYTIRSSDRQTILPLKDVTHSAFSTASTKFIRMAVETAAVREQDGDISEMTVTYVGLTSETSLPPAQIKYIPTTGADIWGPPIVIEVSFVTDLTESQFASGQLSASYPVIERFSPTSKVPMPAFINGTATPQNPRTPGVTTNNLGGNITYFGYCLDSLDSVRRGQFLVARAVFKEKQQGQGVYA